MEMALLLGLMAAGRVLGIVLLRSGPWMTNSKPFRSVELDAALVELGGRLRRNIAGIDRRSAERGAG